MKELDFGQMEQKLQKYMKTKKEKGEKYPSFFGGSSYKDGIITLYLLEQTPSEIKKDIENIIPNVVFKEAKVSKQTLYYCYKQMNEQYLKEDIKKQCDENMIVDFSIDDEHGNITIGIQDLTVEKEELCKELFSNVKDYLSFEEMNMFIKNTPPSECYQDFDITRDYLSSIIGFYTIGDLPESCFITTQSKINISDVICDKDMLPIGTINDIKPSGRVEATFMAYSNNQKEADTTDIILKSTKFRYLKPIVTIDSNASQITTGTILSHHATNHFGISDCYSCEYSSANGDGGAPIIQGTSLLGFHIASCQTKTKTGTKYLGHSCKLKKVLSALSRDL